MTWKWNAHCPTFVCEISGSNQTFHFRIVPISNFSIQFNSINVKCVQSIESGRLIQFQLTAIWSSIKNEMEMECQFEGEGLRDRDERQAPPPFFQLCHLLSNELKIN